MNIPKYETIYLQIEDDDGETTWCQDKINDTDLEYRLVKKRTHRPEPSKHAQEKETIKSIIPTWVKPTMYIIFYGGIGLLLTIAQFTNVFCP